MALAPSTRLVNPRLGTYFAIFAAAFVALVLLALMFEQLGLADSLLRLMMLAGPITLYGAIGVLAFSRDPGDYFVCGRRVPAFFNGLVLATTTLGGAGLLALTGALFFAGFDALCLAIGWLAGLVVMAVLLTPFIRKLGGYTPPAYLARRFDSRRLRTLSALVFCAPLALFLVAEIRFAAFAAAWLLDQPEKLMVLVVALCATAITIAGGMRSLTWAAVAKGIVALLALAVPATIVAVLVSNLPLPQMTHGNVLRLLARQEIARGVPTLIAPPLAFELPGEALEALSKRFIQAFGSVGSLSFVLTAIGVMAGTAASPLLLLRSGTTPTIHEARKSLGWAVLIAGVTLITLSSIAVFLRNMFVEHVVGQAGDRLPAWFQLLRDAGLADVDAGTELVRLANVSFRRDAALFVLPIAAGLPQVIVYLALAGALAAALAAASAASLALSAIIAEDLVHGRASEALAERRRLAAARIALAASGGIAAVVAIAAPVDPLYLVLWALALSAATAFPVLVLSVWWERVNAPGAAAGIIVGLAVAVFILVSAEAGTLALPSVLAGVIALPLAFGAAMFVSLITPAPAPHVLDLLADIRVPGGETLYDREMRLLKLKSRTPS
jgi:cation/acetate symporter